MMTGSRGFVEAYRKQLHPEFPLTEAVSEMLIDLDRARESLVGTSVLASGLKAVLEGDSATHLLRFAKEHIDSLANECSAHEEYAVIMFREFETVEASPELAVAMSNADKLAALQSHFESTIEHVLNLAEGVIEALLSDKPLEALDHFERIVGTAMVDLRKLGIDPPKRAPSVRHACSRLEAKWKSAAEATP